MIQMKKQDGKFTYMAVPGVKNLLTRDDLKKLKTISNAHMYKNICEVICGLLNVQSTAIARQAKYGNIPLARQLVSYYLVMYGDLTLKEIAYLIRPNKPLNHTSIMYHRDTISDYLSLTNKDPHAERVRELVAEIDLKLKTLCA